MKNARKPIMPVLLGGDLNAYSVALSFMKCYRVTSHAFMPYRCGATSFSRFIKPHVVKDITKISVATEVLLSFACENSKYELYLIPCSDVYVALLQKIKGLLSGFYNISLPETRLWKKLKDKKVFYSMLAEDGIPYPSSAFLNGNTKIDKKDLTGLTFPLVLKPSDSAEYWLHPFSDMRKVYFPKSRWEAMQIAEKIFSSGYTGDIILQRLIEGGTIRVFTTYSNKEGRVVAGVLGEVVLEEKGMTSYGNHSAIITLPTDALCDRLVEFLNRKKYVGFANFDIIVNDTGSYVLEINTRQGRSCDYLRGAGINLAELIVEGGKPNNTGFLYNEIYWHYYPHKTVLRYCDNTSKVEAINTLYNTDREFSPYKNSYGGIMQKYYAIIHSHRLKRQAKRSLAKG